MIFLCGLVTGFISGFFANYFYDKYKIRKRGRRPYIISKVVGDKISIEGQINCTKSGLTTVNRLSSLVPQTETSGSNDIKIQTS